MKVCFISLGCDKNLVDTEEMMGLLASKGIELTTDEQDADIVCINTCSFISDAKEESINTIMEMVNLKNEGVISGIIVCGCLAQRYLDEITPLIPEVDAFVGTTAIEKIVDAVESIGKDHQFISVADRDKALVHDLPRVVTTGGHYAFLKISEGCNKACTYCAIPFIRGRARSFPIEELVKKAEYLVNDVGVKELILVAQETTVYGVDLYGEKKLCALIEELSKIEELKWIRLMYCYPEEITDELIQTIKNNPKVCHYLDMPIQHASSKVLKDMGRRTTNSEIKKTIARLRKEIPDIVLRTTMMTGFPGETEEDHKILLEFIKDERIDRLGAFAYSKEDNTRAFSMKNQVNGNTRKRRLKEVMLTQQKVAFELCKEKVGRTLEVLTEGYIPEDDIYVGRSYMDAPGVDGYVFYSCDYELKTGDMVKVQITSSNEYDLIGEVTE